MQDIDRGQMPPCQLKHVLQRRPANPGLVRFVLRGWRLSERLAIILLVQATPTTVDIRSIVSLHKGEFNESTQHLLILADEEVCEWRGMHGHGSRRNRRLSCGSAGRAVNVWRTSRERLRGGTRAASIGSWLAMEGLLQRHAGGLWERCGLRSAKRFRGALPPVGRYGGSHRASNDRPQLSAERSGVTAAAAPTAPARLISAPGG